jgi:hypothetical protein
LSATLYQRWGVQHVAGANKPDYVKLLNAGYRTVTFQPEEPRAHGFMQDAHAHGMTTGWWFEDPSSHDTVMRGGPEDFADDVAQIVRAGDAARDTSGRWSAHADVCYLDIEFTGKGYPTWRASTDVKAWHRWEIDGHEWQLWADGTTDAVKPTFTPGVGATVKDGSALWHYLGSAAYRGWDWNECMMARLRRKVADGGLPTRPMIVQPMGRQGDFNYGAYLKPRLYNTGLGGVPLYSPPARISPQCYDGNMSPYSVATCITEIEINGFVQSHYGFSVPRAYIHPSLSPGHAADYSLEELGPRGYTLFRDDYMTASDLTAYAPYMLP